MSLGAGPVEEGMISTSIVRSTTSGGVEGGDWGISRTGSEFGLEVEEEL